MASAAACVRIFGFSRIYSGVVFSVSHGWFVCQALWHVAKRFALRSLSSGCFVWACVAFGIPGLSSLALMVILRRSGAGSFGCYFILAVLFKSICSARSCVGTVTFASWAWAITRNSLSCGTGDVRLSKAWVTSMYHLALTCVLFWIFEGVICVGDFVSM